MLMKKVIGVLLLLVFMVSCRKEKSDATTCVDGYLHWGGDPALDGSGWSLRTGDENNATYYIPKNLPNDFKTDGLAVTACIEETKEPAPCYCGKNYSKITSIKRR